MLSTTFIPDTTRPKTQYPKPSLHIFLSNPKLSLVLIKNCAVALSAAFVLAIATVYLRLHKPLDDSFVIGSVDGFRYRDLNHAEWLQPAPPASVSHAATITHAIAL